MANLIWSQAAQRVYDQLKAAAMRAQERGKPSKDAGLFKQVHKTTRLLSVNPRHPGLATHKFESIENPYDRSKPVFEAYVQNRTPGAYRIFWCYGPGKGDVTIIAITPHP